jgi:hypothetical protein
VARAVGDGDDAAFHQAWMAAGDRLAAEARAALDRGQRDSARDPFLRVSDFYASSDRPLYGEPVDPRLIAAFRKQIDAFNNGLRRFDPPVEPLRCSDR